jgi:hypothetical protein
MADHFETMRQAIDRARKGLDRNNDPLANREVFRAFLAAMFAAFEGLAYELGGDGSYVSDEMFCVTGPRGAVDSVFLDRIDACGGDGLAARLAHRRAIVSMTYDRARA